jgi:hypothetical protein
VEAEGLFREEVDDALESLVVPHRELDRGDRLAERRPAGIKRAVKIGVVAVQLVDEHQAGEVALGDEAPSHFGPNFDPGGRIHDEHRASQTRSEEWSSPAKSA